MDTDQAMRNGLAQRRARKIQGSARAPSRVVAGASAVHIFSSCTFAMGYVDAIGVGAWAPLSADVGSLREDHYD